MEIRHIELNQCECLSVHHPELTEQYPQLTSPMLADVAGAHPDFPYLFYAIEDGCILSYFRSFPDILIQGDNVYRWAWNGQLYTEPAYRGRGLARAIVQRQLDEFARRDFIWGGVFSSPAALRLYARMKFCMLGHAPRLCLIRDVRPFLRHHTSSHAVVSVAGVVYDAAFIAVSRLLSSGSRFEQRHDLKEIDIAGLSTLLVHRSHVRPEAFYWGRDVSWLEARQAARGIDRIHVIRRRSEIDPCAFLITRDRCIRKRPLMTRYSPVKVMTVMEFGQFDRGADIPDALVGAALLLFARSDADLIEIVTSSPGINAAAHRRGFRALGAGMSFKFMAPPGSPLHQLKTGLPDWHLSHYCGDAFAFE
jgi:GNAT superfamily N-acetyltransferase